MSISGYGTTLSGASLGALTGIEAIQMGDLEVRFDEIATLADVNYIVENLPLSVREGPMVATFNHNKTIMATLRTAIIDRTLDTYTLTDQESSTHAGAAYVAKVGGANEDTQGHKTFKAEFQPQRSWAFTAAS